MEESENIKRNKVNTSFDHSDLEELKEMKKSPSKQELIEMANKKWMPTNDKNSENISERLLGMDPNFTFKNSEIDIHSRQNGYDKPANNSNRYS